MFSMSTTFKRFASLMIVGHIMGVMSIASASPKPLKYGHRPVARGTHWAVVSNNPLATQAGEQILIQGGNAFDAVVAVLAALGVVEPSQSGLGGENFLLAKPDQPAWEKDDSWKNEFELD